MLLSTSARVHPGLRGAGALVASAVLHVLVLGALDAAGVLSLGARWQMPVALVPLTEEQWAVNRLAAGLLAAPREEVLRFVEVPLDAERDPLRERAPPARARHLAAQDQRVLDESVSRDAGVLGDLLRVAQLASEGAEGSGERGTEAYALAGRVGPKGAGGSPEAPPHAVAPSEPDEAGPPSSEEPPSAPSTESIVPLAGVEGGQRVMGEPAAGQPAREVARAEGGPNFDGLDEVPEGEETRLDAHEVRSAPFWVDVRNRIELEWQRRATDTFGRLDPQEDVYFWKKRSAVLKVALGAAGELRKVEVVESSSLLFFDDLAEEAIRASAYPPPPPEALGGNGEASIRVRITWVPSVRRPGLR